MKQLVTAIALSLATAAPALADSVTHLAGRGGLKTQHSFTTDDGNTFTATATSTDKRGKTRKAYVGQYRPGLGVTNSWHDNSHTVDGWGRSETLWLTFDKLFDLTGASFTHVEALRRTRNNRFQGISLFSHKPRPVPAESVSLIGDGGEELGTFRLRPNGRNGHASLDLSGLDYTGNRIGFAATGSHDAWKLKAIHGATAVPTPTAAAAGLLGVFTLIGRRRRRHA